jgi:hypothetical protein
LRKGPSTTGDPVSHLPGASPKIDKGRSQYALIRLGTREEPTGSDLLTMLQIRRSSVLNARFSETGTCRAGIAGSAILVGSSVLGLPPVDGWALIGGIILVAVFLVSWVFLRKSRRRGSGEDIFDSSGRPAR